MSYQVDIEEIYDVLLHSNLKIKRAEITHITYTNMSNKITSNSEYLSRTKINIGKNTRTIIVLIVDNNEYVVVLIFDGTIF